MLRTISSKITPALLIAAMVALLSPLVAQAVTVDVNGTPLSFVNPLDANNQKLSIGTKVTTGFSHRYTNVVTVGSTSVDAIVSLIAVSNLDSDDVQANGPDNLVDDVDRESNTGDPEIRIRLDIFGDFSLPPQTGYATVRVAFVETGTSDAVTLQNVNLNVKDIDDRQFVEFSAIRSYRLSANPSSVVSVSASAPGVTRFAEVLGVSSQSTDEQNWAEVSLDSLSFIDIKLGADIWGSAFFDLGFSALNFTNPPAQTLVAAPTFTLTYDGNGPGSSSTPATSGSGALTVAPGPTRPGFTFSGWNTASDGSGVSLEAGSSFSPAANLTLYAQWIAAPAPPPVPVIRVSLDIGDGSCMVNGIERTGNFTYVSLGYSYLPGPSDCTKNGAPLVNWAEPGTNQTAALPLLVDPSDGKQRFFVAQDRDLVAVWASTPPAQTNPPELPGSSGSPTPTNPGVFLPVTGNGSTPYLAIAFGLILCGLVCGLARRLNLRRT